MLYETAFIQAFGVFIVLLIINGIIRNEFTKYIMFVLNITVFIKVLDNGFDELGIINTVLFLVLHAMILYDTNLFKSKEWL